MSCASGAAAVCAADDLLQLGALALDLPPAFDVAIVLGDRIGEGMATLPVGHEPERRHEGGRRIATASGQQKGPGLTSQGFRRSSDGISDPQADNQRLRLPVTQLSAT